MLKMIGENIRSIRKGKKLSQEELAEASDMHPSHISDIENGKVNASISAYFQIAKALDVPLSELVKFTIGKGGKSDSDLTELFSLVRGLDQKKKIVFVSASRGLISGLEKT